MAPTTKEEVKLAFANADKDGNEKLSLKELEAALLDLANANEDGELEDLKQRSFVEMLMEAGDDDKDKMLSLDDLMKLMDLLENDQKKLMEKMIRASDKDGNGYLTAAELKNLVMYLEDADDVEDAEHFDRIMDMFISMGSSYGSKKLKIDEVMKMLGLEGEEKEEDPKEQMKVMFRMHDTDGDGFVSAKELANGMKNFLGDKEDDTSDIQFLYDMMVAMSDKDGDGKLNYEEFCTAMDDK